MSADTKTALQQIDQSLRHIDFVLGQMPAMPMNDSLTDTVTLVRRLAAAVESINDRVAELEGAMSLLGNLLDERLRAVEDKEAA